MKKHTRKALAAALKELKRSVFRTSYALDTALTLIESSEKRIARLEVAAKTKNKPRRKLQELLGEMPQGLPRVEGWEKPLTAKQLAAIRKSEPQQRGRVVSALLTKKRGPK